MEPLIYTNADGEKCMDFNDKTLFRAIQKVLFKEPTMDSHEMWINLKSKDWPEELLEQAVEGCMLTHFGYEMEKTVVLKARKANEAAKSKCDCCVSLQAHHTVVTKEDIKFYRSLPGKVDPMASKSVPLLRIMMDTPIVVKSFLPRDKPTELDAMSVYYMNPAQRVYALFYAEWRAWMGPPSGQVHAKVKWEEGSEAATFKDFDHCEHEMIYWNEGWKFSFEVHVQRSLQSSCTNWRTNWKWLRYALARTQDQNTIMMINSVLVSLHGVKCCHHGQYFTEWHNWHSDWFYRFRIEGTGPEAIAYVTEKEGDPEMRWQDRILGVAGDYFPPMIVDVGEQSPRLKSRTELQQNNYLAYKAKVSQKANATGNRCRGRQQNMV